MGVSGTSGVYVTYVVCVWYESNVGDVCCVCVWDDLGVRDVCFVRLFRVECT